jgi:hypothetical protein
MLDLKLLGLSGVLAVAGFLAWKSEHDKRIRVQAAASARFTRDSATLVSFRDSLNKVRIRAETSSVHVTRTIAAYDTVRKQIVLTDTTRFVLVDTAFVRSADSVRDACSELESSCRVYRKWADSTITTLERQVINASERACPAIEVTIWQKSKYASVGGLIFGTVAYFVGENQGEKKK